MAVAVSDLEALRRHIGQADDPVGFLTALFADLPAGFALFGRDGRCLATNKAFVDLFGVVPPPEYSLRSDDLLRANGLLEAVERAYAGETVKLPALWYDPRDLTSVQISDGRRVAIAATLFPLAVADGTSLSVAAILADHTEAALAAARLEAEGAELRRLIADLRRSEQELRQSRQELTLIVDNAPVAIAYCDAEQRHVLVNKIYAWRVGLEPQELIGRSMAEVLPPGVYELARPHVERVLAGTSVDFEMEMHDGRGERIYVSCANAPDVDEAGRVRGFVTVITNLTALKRVEREIQQLNAGLEERVAERTSQLEAAIRELAAANRELESFAYSVSHDLRTPLRSINGFAQVLLAEHSDRLDHAGRESLVRIESSARRMGQLIDALLALSRLGRHALDVRHVDTRALLAEVCDELGFEGNRARGDLVLGAMPPCHADASLLKQVFVNLIGNALKFTRPEEPARIEVGCREVDGEQVWSVADQGIGFDMRHAGKLFELFHRLHPEAGYEGTGVGLALVQRIVERHGGRVWAEAQPGRGAAFHFTLGPRAPR